MTQRPIYSAIETTANIGSGMAIAWCLTYYVLPAIWGLVPSPGTALEITVLYTTVSWVRSYLWRRLFARIGNRRGSVV